jgi:transposase
MRVIGLDVSRTVAEVAYLEGGRIQPGGRVELVHPALQGFAKRLRRTDEVVLEATGNTAAIVAALKPHVARVIVANPLQVRLIAEAKVKTDKIDAAVLAQLYASGFLPEVWIPDEDTLALRRQVARRAQIVRQRVRLKNEIHSVLAAHLRPRCPAADLFGRKGRAWLAENRCQWMSAWAWSSGCASWIAWVRISPPLIACSAKRCLKMRTYTSC